MGIDEEWRFGRPTAELAWRSGCRVACVIRAPGGGRAHPSPQPLDPRDDERAFAAAAEGRYILPTTSC